MEKQKLILPISIVVGFFVFGAFFYASQFKKQEIIDKDISSNKISNNEQIDIVKKVEDNKEFEKKVECEKYSEKIQKKIKDYNFLQKPEFRDSNNSGEGEPMINLYVENSELKEVFYSPKVNSCVYLESRKTLAKLGADADPKIGDWELIYETYYLIDVFTGKEIEFNDGLNFLQVVHRGEIFKSEMDTNAIIDTYR